MIQIQTLLSLALFLFFLSRRLPRFLHMFQQEEYDGGRFLLWMIKTRAIDKRVTLLLLAAGALGLSLPAGADGFLPALVFGLVTRFEPDPRRAAKKKLVMTARASRIYSVSFFFSVLVAWQALAVGRCWGAVLAVQMVPFTLPLANLLWVPYERFVQRRIRAAANARLLAVAPRVIGITGSFGKTSVKHILGHVLEMNAPTLYTPGSVNTLMGISRVIREQLHDGCRFFLSEMGAYREGSIRRLCALTPPDAGIVTALGAAHYERFGSLEAVARAKFELADAVLQKPEGFIVVHESVLAQPYARDFVGAHRDRCVVCGAGAGADLVLQTPRQTVKGLEFSVVWQGATFEIYVPLFGVQHAGNCALAFAAAARLGIAPLRIVAALRSVPQITHRLEVKATGQDVTIDDAYNANPHGFQAALDILDLLGKDRKARRVLVTPGVTELGAQHDSVHKELGRLAAAKVDVALVVRADRIPTFAEGFAQGEKGQGGTLVPVPDLAAARAWLAAHPSTQDVVLFENDLPDVYERRLFL